MKLLSVYIEKYKNLEGSYDFTNQDGYIALIGENGSGKSGFSFRNRSCTDVIFLL